MNYLTIKDWQEWQSYRKDRGTPPWIKVHRCLLSNPKWAILSDAEKGQLISIWIVAADNGGQIPNDGNIVRKICQLDTPPNMNKFKDLKFFEQDDCQLDANLTPTCQPLDAPETETEVYRGEVYSKETEADKKGKKFVLPSWICIADWNDYLDSRNKRGKKATVRAMQLVVDKLDELRTKGHDPTRVLQQSIENSWTGVFEIKEQKNGSKTGFAGEYRSDDDRKKERMDSNRGKLMSAIFNA